MDYNSLFWLKPKNNIFPLVPYSELAMHCKAAGKIIWAYCRTGEDYGYILFGDRHDLKLTHGLLSEILPFGSYAYNECKESAMVPASMMFR